MTEVAEATSEDTQVAVAPVSTTTSIVGQDGSFAEGWVSSLPEDIRDEKCLGTCKSVESMARQYINAQKMIGKDKVAKLSENPTAAELEAWHEAGGRPSTAADYNLTRPDEFPEELFNADLATAAQDLFHKIGLSKAQSDALFAFNNENTLKSWQTYQNDAEALRTSTEDALRVEWGSAFDQRKHFGNVAISEGVGGDEEFQARLTEKFGNDANFVKFASNLGAKFAEHGTVTASTIPTPGDIQEQIDELLATPEYRGGPGISRNIHNNALQKGARLFESLAKQQGRQE